MPPKFWLQTEIKTIEGNLQGEKFLPRRMQGLVRNIRLHFFVPQNDFNVGIGLRRQDPAIRIY